MTTYAIVLAALGPAIKARNQTNMHAGPRTAENRDRKKEERLFSEIVVPV
jgi:hypothetical protein